MKNELKERVLKAKSLLKLKKMEKAKITFFDTAYGKLYKADSIRLDNLWAGYITELDFTERLENFAQNNH